ncbi:MAG: vWA domain-containing protein [Acidobacteriota bacterium]
MMRVSPARSTLLPAALAVALIPAPGIEASHLDVAFVLDTTGSMSGELAEAKERVVQVAETLAASRPDATVRLGVVAYRDRGDDYVTKLSPLTENVDETHDFLSTLTANGGGDTPEHVLAGLHVALTQLDWDEAEDVERRVFLIGDAPPQLDYDDAVTTDEILEAARKRDVVIESIGCRSLSKRGVRFFRDVAYATEGRYHHVARVELGTPGVTDVLLDALETDVDRSEPGEPVSAEVLTRDAAGDSPALEATLRHDVLPGVGSRCELQLDVPIGTALDGPPRLEHGDDGLVVRLRLQSGQGESLRLQLTPCLEPSTPVHVVVEK